MKSDPQAVEYAERARRQAIWGSAFVWAGLAGAITYLIAKGNDWDPGTYWAIFGLGFIPGVFLGGASGVNLNKAINKYNGASPMSAKLLPNKIYLSPVTNGGVASLGWSF